MDQFLMMALLASRSKKAKQLSSSERKSTFIESYAMSTLGGKRANPMLGFISAKNAVDKRVAKQEATQLKRVSQESLVEVEQAKADLENVVGLPANVKTLLANRYDDLRNKIRTPLILRR